MSLFFCSSFVATTVAAAASVFCLFGVDIPLTDYDFVYFMFVCMCVCVCKLMCICVYFYFFLFSVAPTALNQLSSILLSDVLCQLIPVRLILSKSLGS